MEEEIQKLTVGRIVHFYPNPECWFFVFKKPFPAIVFSTDYGTSGVLQVCTGQRVCPIMVTETPISHKSMAKADEAYWEWPPRF